MAQHRTGLFRGLFSPFTTRNAKAARRPRGDSRFRSIERLEDRAMMTTTVFIDFGEGLSNHIVTTIGEIRRTLIGPNVPNITPFGDAEVLDLTPLRLVVQQLGIDFNDDGRAGDLTDWTALRNSTVELVRRQFAPFDINVEVAAARSIPEMKAAMARNAGDFTGQFDAYVWAGGIYSGTIPNQPQGGAAGWLGIASAVDLLQNLQNVTDEAVLVDGEFMMNAARQSGWNYAVAMAHVISHEAGHSLGLRHINSGGFLPGQLGTDQDMLSQSELITEGGGSFLNVENTSFFTRYPLVMGDGNVNQAILRNPFEQLANDPDIGVRRNAPTYVTGTGAFDRITITRLDSSTASVTVEPFRDNTFAAGSRITIGGFNGTHTYFIDTSNGIIVDGGRGQDQIVIDSLIGRPVHIHGGQGFDEMIVNGSTLPGVTGITASYTPGSYQVIPGNESYGTFTLDDRRQYFSYSGSIQVGPTRITYDEFDAASTIAFNNMTGLQFVGSEGFDNLSTTAGAAGGNQLGGTVRGVAFPAMRYSNVQSVVIDTGAGPAVDAVTLGAINAAGLLQLTVQTGAGDDFVNVASPNLQVGNPAGAVTLNFGTGNDTLNAYGDVSWTLSDLVLASSAGGAMNLLGIVGETANLVGGPGANTFNVGGWNGRGGLIGGLGLDTVAITRDTNFTFGQTFLNVQGGGRFSLGTIDTLNLTGGAGVNTFIDQGWVGNGTLDGAAGADMIATLRDGNVTLGDTSYVAGDGIFSATMTLTNIEMASLTGGAGANTFDVSQRTIPAAINGGAGADTLVHSRDANVTLTNSQLTVSGLVNTSYSLANVESAILIGGGGSNTFTIAQWVGNGTIVGGAGDDIINIAQGNLDAVTGFWNIIGGVGANDRILLNDSLHGLAANYIISPNSVSIAPGNFRRFGAIFFDGTSELVQLGASQAGNRIDVTPSLGTTFSVDGNGPAGGFADALVLHTAFTGGANGPFNGPGPGQKRFTFNTGHRDVIFEEIEQNVFVP